MLLSRLPRNIKASCHTLRHRLPSKTNSAAHQRLVSSTRWSVAAKYMALRAHSTPWSQLLAQNRDFCLPHLHLTPPLRGFPSEYCYPVRYGKTRMTWLPDGEKFWRYVYSFWHNSRTWRTHRQTDTAWRQRPRLMLASRGKNPGYATAKQTANSSTVQCS